MKIVKYIIMIIMLLTANGTHSVYAFDGGEVFDIQKGEIVKTIEHTASLQKEVEKWLNSNSEPVGSLRIEPDSGIGIKIELAPPVQLKRDWVTGTVTQVVLFVSPLKTYSPTLMIFTKENDVIAVTLNYDLIPFLKANHLYNTDYNLSVPAPK